MPSKNTSIYRERYVRNYSIAILLLIPLIIVLSTLFTASNSRENFEKTVLENTTVVNEAIASTLPGELSNPIKLQTDLTGIKHRFEEIKQSRVLITTPDGSKFKILSSTEPAEMGQILTSAQYTSAVKTGRTSALRAVNNNSRVLRVVTPILDEESGVVALLETDISSVSTERLMNNGTVVSYFSAGVAAIMIILLLLRQMKLVDYGQLVNERSEYQKLRTDFLRIIGREISAPIEYIGKNISDLIESQNSSLDTASKGRLQAISTEANHLAQSISDLSTAAELELGNVDYDLQLLNIGDIVDQLTKRFLPKTKSKGLAISYAKPVVPTYALVDKERFVEIVTRLLDNAVRYTDKGTVTLSHMDDLDNVIISIKDTGVGINPNIDSQLFGRLYVEKSKKDSEDSGLGLGLWITRQHIDNMSGTLEVDSQEGIGTEFRISFKNSSNQPTV